MRGGPTVTATVTRRSPPKLIALFHPLYRLPPTPPPPFPPTVPPPSPCQLPSFASLLARLPWWLHTFIIARPTRAVCPPLLGPAACRRLKAALVDALLAAHPQEVSCLPDVQARLLSQVTRQPAWLPPSFRMPATWLPPSLRVHATRLPPQLRRALVCCLAAPAPAPAAAAAAAAGAGAQPPPPAAGWRVVRAARPAPGADGSRGGGVQPPEMAVSRCAGEEAGCFLGGRGGGECVAPCSPAPPARGVLNPLPLPWVAPSAPVPCQPAGR